MDLSIIIACSRPSSIRDCLKSLETQTGNFQFEVLIVGLVDKIRDEIFQLEWRVFACKEPHPNVRRNIGLENAKSQMIAFLDDDTIPDRNWVSTAVHYSDPERNIVLAGLERPFDNKSFGTIVFEASKSILSEGTRAHVNTKFEKVSWTDVPFCNCVIPKKLIVEVGGLAVDIPWHMDDFEFFNRAQKKAEFWNVPQLSIMHDRYPDSLIDLSRYRWRLRLRTGEKLITHPGVYWQVTPVAAAAIFPAVGCLLLYFSPLFTALLFSLYMGIILCQIPQAIRVAKKSFWLYLQILITIHVITIVGIQVGMIGAMVRCLIRRSRLKLWIRS